jgi:hypothetical protein
MQNVGFDGGHSVYELGPPSDVAAFFSAVEQYAAIEKQSRNYGLIIDRLYRRYLRQEELDAAAALMGEIRTGFSEMSPESLGLKEFRRRTTSTRLQLNQSTPDKVFADYFEKFARAKESAESFYDSFKIYQPVRTLIVDQPWFMVEKQRPLSEYDALRGEPFWLRSSG